MDNILRINWTWLHATLMYQHLTVKKRLSTSVNGFCTRKSWFDFTGTVSYLARTLKSLNRHNRERKSQKRGVCKLLEASFSCLLKRFCFLRLPDCFGQKGKWKCGRDYFPFLNLDIIIMVREMCRSEPAVDIIM